MGLPKLPNPAWCDVDAGVWIDADAGPAAARRKRKRRAERVQEDAREKRAKARAAPRRDGFAAGFRARAHADAKTRSGDGLADQDGKRMFENAVFFRLVDAEVEKLVEVEDARASLCSSRPPPEPMDLDEKEAIEAPRQDAEVAKLTGTWVPEAKVGTASKEAPKSLLKTVLRSSREEDTFRGVLQGFSQTRAECGPGRHCLLLSGFRKVVVLMRKRTKGSMKAAMVLLSDWLQPVALALEDSGAKSSSFLLASALQRLRVAKVSYRPGQSLMLDNLSIFALVNNAVASFAEKRHFMFGRDLGHLLRQLALKFPATLSDVHGRFLQSGQAGDEI